MYRRLPFFSTMIAVSLLAGCASTPNISLEKTSDPLNTLALLHVAESQQFTVRNLSGLPALGGAIGGAIAGATEASRTKAFIEAYNTSTTRLSTALVGDLQDALAREGKQVSYLPDQVAKLKNNADDYSHISTDKDAVLSVWFGPVGYIADGVIDAPFEPWVIVHVRLLHRTTKQVISQKTYTGGYKAKLDGAVFVPCASEARYSSFDQLMANQAASVRALAQCEQAIARKAAADLI